MISLLVVNYRSAALAAEAIRSARAAASEKVHVVAVDNSLDDVEAASLRQHADDVVVSPRNSGYAGAINMGRPHCQGEFMIVTNPDVVFAPGSIDRLVSALSDPTVAVAGPALFWDTEHRWILPPADEQTLSGKADEVIASRSNVFARRRDRRRIRKRLQFWSLRDTTKVRALSGAVLAIRTSYFDEVGGFDDRFPLYFEENDFLRRVQRAGRGVVYVPAARCRHIYDQSAGSARAHAASAYGSSEIAYFHKWYGGFSTALVTRLGRALPPAHSFAENDRLSLPRSGLVVEASPLPSFATAAGLLEAPMEVDLPAEVWSAYKSDAVYLRAVDPKTAEVVATAVRPRR